jgi:LUD domain
MMLEQAAGYTIPAGSTQREALATRLRERNFAVLAVADADAARAAVLALLPEGAEGALRQVQDAPGCRDIRRAHKIRPVQLPPGAPAPDGPRNPGRPDPQAGRRAGLRARQRPGGDRAGQLVAASGSGSQIGPYASGAAQLILVIGAQKVVPDLDAALRRIAEHIQPYEDMRLRELTGEGTQLARVLILERDFRPGRTTIILVREPIGV